MHFVENLEEKVCEIKQELPDDLIHLDKGQGSNLAQQWEFMKTMMQEQAATARENKKALLQMVI